MDIRTVRALSCICLSAYLLVSNCPVHGEKPEDPSEFGYVSNMSVGTSAVASGMSQSLVRMSDWTPVYGPIPRVELDLNHKGQLMENEKEIS